MGGLATASYGQRSGLHDSRLILNGQRIQATNSERILKRKRVKSGS